MAKTTISTFQLFKLFPDQETARLYLESRLWPNGITCPVCKSGERITTRKGGYYRCNGRSAQAPSNDPEECETKEERGRLNAAFS